MKTHTKLATELTENAINTRLHHKTFLEFSAKTPHTKAKRIVRGVDKANHGILAMLGIEDYTAQSRISLHPEFVAFAFHLYGLSRKLFIYIIFYEMNNDSCRFSIDTGVAQRFREFCSLFGEAEPSEKTIQQAIRCLVRKNTMIQFDEGNYMLNPLIAGGANENKRRKLIEYYSLLLQKKGLDAAVDFYPRYLPGL